MTRVGYLLPFLWALVCGTTVSNTISPTTTTITTATSTSSVTTQAASAVATVKHTVGQSSPTVPTSAANTPATTKPPTTQSPSVTAVTKTLLTPESKASQADIQTTTVRTETKSVAATSSGPSLGPLNGNIPNVTSSSDNSPQPTDLPKASTSVLKSSTVVVIPPNITENVKQFTTQLTATSPTYSRTSEPSTGKKLIIDSTVASTSTESPSPVTTAKTTTIDSTTSLPKETIPMTTELVNPIQKNLEKIEINCTTEIGGSLVKININPSSICGEYDSKNEDEAKEILKHICSAIKPGYKPDQEKCHIDLGRGPNELVIVNAYVQSSLSTDDLYASLKHIKKDGSFLFNYGAKYEEEDLVSIPLISVIVSMAVALLIAAAIYGCCHQRQTRKREQRLTEELQTMENGYHDNPTLEVMETSPEMQEKKGGPNGELGDSWIVPLDNLTREDFDEEEDTHL